MNISTLLGSILVLSSSFAFAAGGDSSHIPFTELIVPQIVNFLIVVTLLTFLTKKMIKEHFAARKESFSMHLKKAEAAKEKAEETHRLLKERLDKLEQTASSSIEEAKAEAAELKHRIIADAKSLSTRLEEEAKRTASYELEKAKAHLREDLLQMSFQMAEGTLQENVNADEQKRLQSEFVEKIQVVR